MNSTLVVKTFLYKRESGESRQQKVCFVLGRCFAIDSAGYVITHASWTEGVWTERPFIDGVHITELVRKKCKSMTKLI